MFKSDNKDLISLFTGEPRKDNSNSLAARLGSKLLQDLQNKSMALQNELTTSQRLQQRRVSTRKSLINNNDEDQQKFELADKAMLVTRKTEEEMEIHGLFIQIHESIFFYQDGFEPENDHF